MKKKKALPPVATEPFLGAKLRQLLGGRGLGLLDGDGGGVWSDEDIRGALRRVLRAELVNSGKQRPRVRNFGIKALRDLDDAMRLRGWSYADGAPPGLKYKRRCCPACGHEF
jgi:hypothetical protein